MLQVSRYTGFTSVLCGILIARMLHKQVNKNYGTVTLRRSVRFEPQTSPLGYC